MNMNAPRRILGQLPDGRFLYSNPDLVFDPVWASLVDPGPTSFQWSTATEPGVNYEEVFEQVRQRLAENHHVYYYGQGVHVDLVQHSTVAVPPSWYRADGNDCRVFWNSHGCGMHRGHQGPHVCGCCDCEDHPDDPEVSGYICVAAPPYYGDDTVFFGEDA